MRHYFYAFCFITILLSCDNLSTETKKQIKKTGKEITKQVVSTVEYFDGAHDYIGYEAKTDSSEIRMYWKDDVGKCFRQPG